MNERGKHQVRLANKRRKKYSTVECCGITNPIAVKVVIQSSM